MCGGCSDGMVARVGLHCIRTGTRQQQTDRHTPPPSHQLSKMSARSGASRRHGDGGGMFSMTDVSTERTLVPSFAEICRAWPRGRHRSDSDMMSHGLTTR